MKNNVTKNKLYMFIGLLGITVVLCIYGNVSMGMLFSVVLFFGVFAKAKISFFTEISFILVFSLFQTWVQYEFQSAYGMIQNAKFGVPLYAKEHVVCTLSFLVTLLFFIYFTDIIKNEKKLYRRQIELKMWVCILFILIATALVIMLFPSIPIFTLGDDRRTQGISSIYGFALVSLLLVGLTFDMSFKYKFLWIFYGFIIFWFLGHAERVEVLGLVSYMVLKGTNRKEIKKLCLRDYLKSICLGVSIFGFLMFLIWIGLYRDISARNQNYSIILVLQKLFVQGTAGDVVYVFDCAVDMWKRGELLHGKTYLDWLLQLIPGADTKYGAAVVIKEYYFTMGGALFFTEPMMNFGILGVLITNIVFCIGYYNITKEESTFRCMFWIPIVIEVFRICWYGRNSWILASFVEIPLLYIFMKYIMSKIVFVYKNKFII